MSLQIAAKHLAAHGRGGDTELVHMDKGEIKSLQALAKQHGGQLTINPHTGLPEAGFLSAILPMALGAGLMMIPGMQAMGAAGIVGALKTAQSGSLKQGIMAGLGAYGGAGLAGSAGAAGAGSTTTLNGAPITAPTPTPPAVDINGFTVPAADVAPVNPSALTSTTAGATGASGVTPYTPTPAVQGTGNINGLTETNAQSFGASNPNAGIQSGQAPITQGGTTPDVTGRPLNDPMYSDYGGATKGLPEQTYEVTPKDFNAMNASERATAIKNGASISNAADWAGDNKYAALGAATSVAAGMRKDPEVAQPDKDMGQRYSFTGGKITPVPAPDVPTYEDMMKGGNFGRQQRYFNQPTYTPISAAAAKDLYHFAGGGPVEQMSNQNAIGANTGFPQAYLHNAAYATPYQTPMSQNVLAGPGDVGVDPYTGEQKMAGGGLGRADFDIPEDQPVGPLGQLLRMGSKQSTPDKKYTYNPDEQQYQQQMATGGISDAHYNLGGYSDGGRLLRGPGDGVSDSIPAVIGKKQPARLADGEFVVPARIVSELGNGSTEAGARKLYAMMDRIQASRKKSIGKGKVAHNNRADKYLPA